MSAVARLWLLALALGPSAAAEAQLAFSLRTGIDATKTQKMVFDSNKCPTEGPTAMYVGGRVTNSGATTRTNVTATLSGLTNGFILAGGQPATLELGSIAPGQSAGAYWFIGYGCTNATSNPMVTMASDQGSSSIGLTMTGTATLSANATGFLQATTLGPGAVVGQVIFLDVQYSFGGTDIGDEFYLQPSGAQTFNAGCFRLVGNEIVQSQVSGIPAGTTHRTYFTQTAKDKKTTVTSRYFFEYQCEGASTQVRPYAMGTSGTQLKYTGNYDSAATSFTITFPGATNPFTITKTADIATAPGGVRNDVTYTVTVLNPSTNASRITRFVDVLPAGATFKSIHATSDVTAANSSSVPAVGDSGTIIFQGTQDLSYLIPAGGSVTLVYTVSMSSLPGTYVNSAQARFGQATTPAATASFEVTTPLPLTVVKSSQVASDPHNGAVNPKAIPGARMTYALMVANPNGYLVTNNSLDVVDATPAGLDLSVADLAAGAGPVLFSDGGSSALSYTYGGLASTTDDIEFSNDNGASWAYAPVPNAAGTDPAVTHVRIRPKGSMAPNSSFTLNIAYAIE